MTLSKEQCEEILNAASHHSPCNSNYHPALAAFAAGDYDLFEKICRGNYLWLKGHEIPLLMPIEGPYVCFRPLQTCTGTLNEEGHNVGISLTVDDSTGVVDYLEYYNANSDHVYTLENRDYSLDSKEAMKAIADALYQQLGLQLPTQE